MRFLIKVFQKLFKKRSYINEVKKIDLTKSTLQEIAKKIIEEEKKTAEINNQLKNKMEKLKKISKFKSVI